MIPQEGAVRLCTSIALSAFAMVLPLGGLARADLDFTLSAAPDPAYFTIAGPAASILEVGQTGTTTLFPGELVMAPTGGALVTGLAGIDVTYARPYVTSTLGMPEAVSFRYGYDVTVNDLATGASATVLVTGTIGGTASSDESNLAAFGFSATPSTLDLGGNNYTITASVSPLDGTPTGGTAPNVLTGVGSLVLHIADPPAGSDPTAIPEPDSIVLLGLGSLGVLGLLRRRRAEAT